MGQFHGPYKDNQSLEEAFNQFRSQDDEVVGLFILEGKMVPVPKKPKKIEKPLKKNNQELVDIGLF